MDTRVTDFRIDRVEMAVDDYWRLPPRARELIHLYGRELVGVAPIGRFVFELAIYRWPEIEAAMRVLPAGGRREP